MSRLAGCTAQQAADSCITTWLPIAVQLRAWRRAWHSAARGAAGAAEDHRPSGAGEWCRAAAKSVWWAAQQLLQCCQDARLAKAVCACSAKCPTS